MGATLVAVLACQSNIALAAKRKPHVAPQQPVAAVAIPLRPYPPNGAAPNMVLPPVDAAGLRKSVNRGISPAQIVWNLRSAYNVAALNCMQPKHAEILTGYRNFLNSNLRTLLKANRTVDAEFRGLYGKRSVASREKYMTVVYNHFAFPPIMTEFCDAVLVMSREAQTVKATELEAFAARSLPSIEVVYDDFYRRYEQYRADLAAWEASYGNLAMTQPGTGSGQRRAQ